MKRIVTFVVFHLSALRKPYRWICTAAVLLLMLNTSVSSANLQSKDRDNPTPLTSTEISGRLSRDNDKENYHYSFVAGPGEVKITLTVQSGGNVNQVDFDLFDEDAKKIAGNYITASRGRSEQVIERVNISRRQTVLLRIILYNSGPGNYKIRLSGAVDVGRDNTYSITGTGPGGAVTAHDVEVAASEQLKQSIKDNPECLPKKGILRVKMKDGSVRRIDLGEAEEITIEH